MLLLLSRHGNTFNPEDIPVWTGTRNDLPLSKSGIEQAQAFGEALVNLKLVPEIVFVSELQRVHNFAKIALNTANLDLDLIKIHPSLLEIDYGSWTGLTNDEVSSKFGVQALESWDKNGIWPKDSDWLPSEEQIITNIEALVKKLLQNFSGKLVVVISSNGILRYFLNLVDGLFSEHQLAGKLKTKTGNSSLFSFDKDVWSLNFWNQNPKDWKIEDFPGLQGQSS